jgi:hypothetical protein
MGTTHGAKELGFCPHGLACQAGAWGHYIGFCLGYGHMWKIQTSNGRQKYSARPITLSYDGILTNGLLPVKRGTLEMRIVVSPDRGMHASKLRNARASYWHILNLVLTCSIFTFSPY